jgi:D-alanine transaminase
VEDRGYQFADGVYEVIAVADGRLMDEGPHLDRLERSLSEIRMAAPMSRRALGTVLREIVRRNRVRRGIVYLQVSRGIAPRDHPFPSRPGRPSMVATARSIARSAPDANPDGVRVITLPDIRWARCDIKSIGLLPNVLAKQMAVEAGAYEAWQVDDAGAVTEGASTNAWIVDGNARLVTRPIANEILSGVTRRVVLELARAEGVGFEERPFTVAEAKAAPEAFLTSTTSLVLPVVAIDGSMIGTGEPGPVTRRLQSALDLHLAGIGLAEAPNLRN